MSKKHAEQSRRLFPSLFRFFAYSRAGMQMLGSTLVFVGVSAFFIYEAFYQQYQQIMEIFQIVDPSMQRELIFNDIFIRNVIFLALTALIYTGTIGFLFFRAQQEFAGPVSAIEAFVADMTRGEYRHRIMTRKGDQLQDIVLALNQMAEALEHKHLVKNQSAAPEYDKVADS